MTPVLVLLAVLVAAGGVVTVSAREPRLAALGAVVVILGAAFIVDPLPGVVPLAARMVGSVLAGFLIWVSLRDAPPLTTGWRMGWPGAAAVAIVAFTIGWLAAGTLGTELGSLAAEGPSVPAATSLANGSLVARAALGAALALTALAASPVLLGRDVLRLGLGLLLVLAAATLLRNALTVGTDDIVELGLAVLTAVAGAAVAALVGRSLDVHGDLELRGPGRTDAALRHRPVDEAHPRHGPATPARTRPPRAGAQRTPDGDAPAAPAPASSAPASSAPASPAPVAPDPDPRP